MDEALIQRLRDVGKPPEVYQSSDGSEVLLLPYGGRVLGLFSAGSGDNLYWTHASLESVDSARAFYAGSEWHNSGGDRTWLSPEADLFFPNFPSLDQYWQPRELDPGSYQVVRTGDDVRLVNRLTCTLSRSKQAVGLEINKSFAPAPNPLRYERDAGDLLTLAYAGYTQHTSLRMMEGSEHLPVQVGLWNLVQMPHGGDLLVPTFSRTQPKVYFGTIGADDLIVGDRLVRYRMRAAGEHKIGIRAVATTGRVGYVYSAGSQWALIIRNFFVNPSGEYVDVPWTDTADLGYSTQACNVNSGLGRFSELEYHIPAIGRGTGRTRCDDSAQVWAFRGPSELIRGAARILLSPDAEVK
jgi:hypothetical protein